MKANNQPLRYVAYIRKSEERTERQELSHKAQERKIKEQFPGLNIVEWLEPESKSAFKPGRPIFKQLMQKIKDGEADGIVAYHPNRLARNEIDSAEVTYALRTYLKDLKFCNFSFENSIEGIMILQMIMSQGQYESSKQGRDVKRGMEQKALEGERPGQVPQGYIKLPVLDGEGRVMKRKDNKLLTHTCDDPERYERVKLMWKMFLYEDYSAERVWRIATNEWGFVTRKTTVKTGGKPMPKSMIYAIFTNRFYTGYIKHNNEWYEGHHNAMITPEEFEYAQKLLGAKGKPRRTARNFAYGSLIRCGVCNCQIVAKGTTKLIKRTGELKTYVHYYCTRKSLARPCSQIKYTTVGQLEKDIDAELAKYTIIPEFRDMALKILRRNHKSEVHDRTTIYESQQSTRKQIQKQLDKLTGQLTRGVVEENEYMRKRDALKVQLADLDGGLRSTEKRAEDWLELTEKVFDFATYARIRFNETDDPKVKRNILQTLGANFLLTDNKLTLEPKKWLTPIKVDYPTLEKAYLKVRTNKIASATDIEEAISRIMMSWRPKSAANAASTTHQTGCIAWIQNGYTAQHSLFWG